LVRWISNPEAGRAPERTNEARLTRGRRTVLDELHVLREVSEEDTARPPKVDSCRAAVYNDALALACPLARAHARRGGERRTREKRKAGHKGGKRTSCRSRRGVKRDAAITPLDPCGCIRNMDNAREIGRRNYFSRVEKRISAPFVNNV
ncbi:hypothetical protein ALC60_06158, partial [Trachymyrmex zeteki]